MVPLPYLVSERREQTHDVVSLDLEPTGQGIGEPVPGQFSMLYAFGVGEAAISVSGCPAEDGRLGHTVRAVGAVTRALCQLGPGDALGVRGPFGTGWPLAAAAGLDLLMIGGGIGLAPLRPVIRRVLAERAHYGRVGVVIGARTPADLLYRQELEQWRGRFDLDVHVTVDAAPAGWRGEVGVVTTLLPRLAVDPSRVVALLCGPEVMMRIAARALVDMGVDAERIHVSLERNMQCAIRQCGHCQLGPLFVCAEGPVVRWSLAGPLVEVRRW
jgi:NAD(P)H-flavin reductase